MYHFDSNFGRKLLKKTRFGYKKRNWCSIGKDYHMTQISPKFWLENGPGPEMVQLVTVAEERTNPVGDQNVIYGLCAFVQLHRVRTHCCNLVESDHRRKRWKQRRGENVDFGQGFSFFFWWTNGSLRARQKTVGGERWSQDRHSEPTGLFRKTFNSEELHCFIYE